MSKLYRAKETAYSRPRKVKRAEGILEGVKLLGKVSRNGREYTDKALAETAKHYEQLGIDLDHRKDARQERSVRDLIAVRPRNVKVEADGIYADVHLLTSDPIAQKILEAADKDPAVFGFSHEADLSGTQDRSTGKLVVESVPKVYSLDMVRHPATTNGVFESEDFSSSHITEAEEEMDGPGYLHRAMMWYQDRNDSEKASSIHELLKPASKAAPETSEDEPEEEETDEFESIKQLKAEIASLKESVTALTAKGPKTTRPQSHARESTAPKSSLEDLRRLLNARS